MTAQKKEPEKHFTVTPSVVVFRCIDYPVALLVLHYVLIRKKIYPKFRIGDMAQQLNKDKRTIRAAVKVLRELELLVLKGEIGNQYYEFNQSKYDAYLLINPFETGDAPSQKMRV
jgi:DNA-binding transcriptional ArsR family regulator